MPVIDDVFRVVLPWVSTQGIQPVNVLHVMTDTPQTYAAVAAVIDASFSNGMFGPVASSSTLSQIKLTKLDGASATYTHTLTTPRVGQATGQSILNLSACLNFSTARRGSRGRGRIFLGPTTEDYNSGANAWAGASQTGLRNAWIAFQVALVAATPTMHQVVASYKWAEAYIIDGWEADSILRSTKSRLNQLTR